MQGKRAILAIDNDEGHRFILQESLSELGEVTLATSGREGILAMASQPFDVVVTDYRMDNGNGIDVARHILENQLDIPVILITSFGFYELAKRAYKNGVFDFVEKPFQKQEMQGAVRRAFEVRDGKRWKRVGELCLEMQDEIEKGRESLSQLLGLTRKIRNDYLLYSGDVTVLRPEQFQILQLPLRRKLSKNRK